MKFTATLLSILIFVSGCGKEDTAETAPQNTFSNDGSLEFLRPDGSVIATLQIEVVESEEAQARGLMGRRSMPPGTGMLFIYDAPKDQSFWMKNTPLPLDIIFIGADSSVVNIVKRTKPLSTATIESTSPAQYVLEVRAGLTDRLGVDSTTTFNWQINRTR